MNVIGCAFDKSRAGMFLWGKNPGEYSDCEELAERILLEGRVIVAPGFIFGSSGKRYIRISSCAKEERLSEALSRPEQIN